MMKIDKITNTTEEILNKAYARRLIPDETGGYVASIQEFPGCIAEGDTPEDAINNLEAAAASWVEAALSSGYEIRDPVSFHGYSGKIALRIPRGLHQQVAELAELEDSSMNQLLIAAISQYLGGKRVFRELSETMLADLRKEMTSRMISIYHDHSLTFVMPIQIEGEAHFGFTATNQNILTKNEFNLASSSAPQNKRLLTA